MKVFICVFASICAIVVVDGQWMPHSANIAAEIMKRSMLKEAMDKREVSKRQQKKECCLPKAFSTSGTIRYESVRKYSWQEDEYRDSNDVSLFQIYWD